MKAITKIILAAGLVFAVQQQSHAQQSSRCDFMSTSPLADSLQLMLQPATSVPQFKNQLDCFAESNIQLLDIPQPVIKFNSNYCDYFNPNPVMALLFPEDDMQKSRIKTNSDMPLSNGFSPY